jgi:hypothetical protein
MGTIYQILELQIFPWILNGVPSFPLRVPTQLLAILIKDESEPFKFNKLLLSACPHVNNLFHCNFSTLKIIPKNESFLIAIDRKQFSQAKQLCIFQPYNAETVVPIQNNLYLVYSDNQQFPSYNCNRNLIK